ncbi:MAG TPA: hypothetical protein VKA67_07660, partial [Verrucomicrobiae bacterium]|nr:hypothetical protein [Verrucomicrobiae bacterium]
MKSLILNLAFLLGLVTAALAQDLGHFSLTTNAVTEVKQKMGAYEKGNLSLMELTENSAWNDKLLAYYQEHTNEVPERWKMPISRCFAGLGKYPEAARLAADYVQVYSNDWHGWKILGGAYVFMGRYKEALAALTNSMRLGDEGSYAPVAMVALHLDRLDIV